MRIAIIGRSQLLFETATLLQREGYSIPLIVTAKEAPEYSKTAEDFRTLADELGAEFIYTPKINLGEYVDIIKKLDPIDLAVSINYTGVISQEVIDLFPLGILNAHAGDLPKYRGNAPLAWAIINNEDKAGLCIHRMIGGELDSGNILAKNFYEININTRIGQLFEWIEKEIPVLMLKAVKRLKEDSNFLGEEQSKDPKDALRGYPRLPEDGKINWKVTSEEIIRLINGSSEPFSGAFCEFEGNKMEIWRAGIYEDEENYSAIPGQVSEILANGNIVVITGQGKIVIQEVSFQNERNKPGYFIKSIRKRLK